MEAVETYAWDISRQEAEAEIVQHGLRFADFLAECGDRESYNGKTVMEWLGY